MPAQQHICTSLPLLVWKGKEPFGYKYNFPLVLACSVFCRLYALIACPSCLVSSCWHCLLSRLVFTVVSFKPSLVNPSRTTRRTPSHSSSSFRGYHPTPNGQPYQPTGLLQSALKPLIEPVQFMTANSIVLSTFQPCCCDLVTS